VASFELRRGGEGEGEGAGLFAFVHKLRSQRDKLDIATSILQKNYVELT